jgi:hypothetical protein
MWMFACLRPIRSKRLRPQYRGQRLAGGGRQSLAQPYFSGPIDVKGAAPQHSGMVEFCRAGGNTFSTDFDQFTSYAVASATDILHRNHIETIDGAEKKIVLSVTEATCEQEAFDINFIAHVDATCGDQASRRFTGNQRIWTM